MKKRYWFLLIALSAQMLPMPGFSVKASVAINVFVHGTVLPGLTFLTPQMFWQDVVAVDSYYVQSVKNVRSKLEIFEDSLMLGEGLNEISRSDIEAARQNRLEDDKKKKAPYFIMSAYDAMAQATAYMSSGDNIYLLYGWSGVLSQQERKDCGLKLYNELCLLRDIYAQRDIEVIFRIIAYSHGGNVVLWLAHAEDSKKAGLIIESLTLLAVPIQKETAQFIPSAMFKSIVSFYSEGDNVQNRDFISTNVSESFTKMGHLLNLAAFHRTHSDIVRCDARILINDQNTLGHSHFFHLADDAVHHTAGLMPLVVFVPALLQQIKKYPNCLLLDVNINFEEDSIKVYVTNGENSFCLKRLDAPSINLHPIITAARNVTGNWQGQKRSFLQQTFKAIKSAH